MGDTQREALGYDGSGLTPAMREMMMEPEDDTVVRVGRTRIKLAAMLSAAFPTHDFRPRAYCRWAHVAMGRPLLVDRSRNASHMALWPEVYLLVEYDGRVCPARVRGA